METIEQLANRNNSNDSSDALNDAAAAAEVETKSLGQHSILPTSNHLVNILSFMNSRYQRCGNESLAAAAAANTSKRLHSDILDENNKNNNDYPNQQFTHQRMLTDSYQAAATAEAMNQHQYHYHDYEHAATSKLDNSDVSSNSPQSDSSSSASCTSPPSLLHYSSSGASSGESGYGYPSHLNPRAPPPPPPHSSSQNYNPVMAQVSAAAAAFYQHQYPYAQQHQQHYYAQHSPSSSIRLPMHHSLSRSSNSSSSTSSTSSTTSWTLPTPPPSASGSSIMQRQQQLQRQQHNNLIVDAQRSSSTASEKHVSTATPTTPTATKRPKSTFPFGKCKVCNDKATGVHYGISTCEGCKGFFKRSTLRREKYRCFFGNNCPLTPDNRNRCKACRFKKCLEVGMSVQGVKMGRIPKAEKERALMNLNNSSLQEKEEDYDQLDETNVRFDCDGISDNEDTHDKADDMNDDYGNKNQNDKNNVSENQSNRYYYTTTAKKMNDSNNNKSENKESIDSCVEAASSGKYRDEHAYDAYDDDDDNDDDDDAETDVEANNAAVSAATAVAKAFEDDENDENDENAVEKGLVMVAAAAAASPEVIEAEEKEENSSEKEAGSSMTVSSYRRSEAELLSNIRFGSLSISPKPNTTTDGNDHGQLCLVNNNNKRKYVEKTTNENNETALSLSSSSSSSLQLRRHRCSNRETNEQQLEQPLYRTSDRNFTIVADLLDIHTTFVKSASSMLARTHLLTPLAYDRASARVDQSIQMVMALLTDRVYQIHVEHMKGIREKLENVKRTMAVVSSCGRRSSPLLGRKDVTLSDVWDGLLESIPRYVRGMISISRELPGINELGARDFATLINHQLFAYFAIRKAPLFIDGESYNVMPNDVQYTRYWMERVIGSETTHMLFEWTREFNELELTQREIALHLPFLFTMHCEKYEDPATMNNLNEYYYRALLYEFDLNQRGNQFLTQWKNIVITKLAHLNELQRKNIGNLKPKSRLSQS